MNIVRHSIGKRVVQYRPMRNPRAGMSPHGGFRACAAIRMAVVIYEVSSEDFVFSNSWMIDINGLRHAWSVAVDK